MIHESLRTVCNATSALFVLAAILMTVPGLDGCNGYESTMPVPLSFKEIHPDTVSGDELITVAISTNEGVNLSDFYAMQSASDINVYAVYTDGKTEALQTLGMKIFAPMGNPNRFRYIGSFVENQWTDTAVLNHNIWEFIQARLPPSFQGKPGKVRLRLHFKFDSHDFDSEQEFYIKP